MLGGASITTIEARIRAGVWPLPALSGSVRVWPEHEVTAMLSALEAGLDNDRLTVLARELESERPKRARAAIANAIGADKAEALLATSTEK